MIEEVNKIIYNMLISGRGVHLPDVGSLYIERQGARKISDDRLLSPRNVVAFSSREQAPSLVEEIVAIAGCAREQAEDIYARWIAKTRTDGVVKIGGVGELKGKSFVMEKAFNSAINPKGVKTLVIRRRSSNGWLYAVCGVCVVVALCVCGYLMWGDQLLSKSGKGEPTQLVAEQDVVMPAAEEATDIATEAAQPAQPSASASASASTATTQPQQPAQSTVQAAVQSYSYYVVMGIFSTDANASRAIEQVRSKINDAACVVLPFKDKYMVTIYGSNSREECNAYARSYRDIYPDLWVYNRK